MRQKRGKSEALRYRIPVKMSNCNRQLNTAQRGVVNLAPATKPFESPYLRGFRLKNREVWQKCGTCGPLFNGGSAT